MGKHQVWNEGYATSGESGTAQILTRENGNSLWEGNTFQEACENALITLNWDMRYYDKQRNTYWGCRFFDNEAQARKSFG